MGEIWVPAADCTCPFKYCAETTKDNQPPNPCSLGHRPVPTLKKDDPAPRLENMAGRVAFIREVLQSAAHRDSRAKGALTDLAAVESALTPTPDVQALGEALFKDARPADAEENAAARGALRLNRPITAPDVQAAADAEALRLADEALFGSCYSGEGFFAIRDAYRQARQQTPPQSKPRIPAFLNGVINLDDRDPDELLSIHIDDHTIATYTVAQWQQACDEEIARQQTPSEKE